MKGAATGKVIDWANGELMTKMDNQFSAADYSTFGALLIVRFVHILGKFLKNTF